jgi:hypothetical protein
MTAILELVPAIVPLTAAVAVLAMTVSTVIAVVATSPRAACGTGRINLTGISYDAVPAAGILWPTVGRPVSTSTPSP